MAIKLWSLVLIMMFFNPLHAEELDCKGGSLFEEKKFQFKETINSNEIQIIEKIFVFSEDQQKKISVTMEIKDFLINYITLIDYSNGFTMTNMVSGLKGGSFASMVKKKGLFINCSIY